MENRGLSEAESTALINVQMSLDKKSEKADFVIENSGNIQDLKQQVLDIHQKLNQSTLHWKIRLGIGIALGGLVGMFYLVVKQCGNILNVGGKTQVLAANTLIEPPVASWAALHQLPNLILPLRQCAGRQEKL